MTMPTIDKTRTRYPGFDGWDGRYAINVDTEFLAERWDHHTKTMASEISDFGFELTTSVEILRSKTITLTNTTTGNTKTFIRKHWDQDHWEGHCGNIKLVLFND